jgi:hypothetical protein
VQMRTVGGSQPLHARRGEQVHAVVGLESQLLDGGADCQRNLLELDEALVRVRAQLKVLPVLVDLGLLAVDHLLDLLRLGDLVDNASRADGLCVAKVFRGIAQDLVHGGDVWGGRVFEPIFGGDVAARYRLALDGLCVGGFGSIRASPRGLGLRREFLEVLHHDDGRGESVRVVCERVEIEGEGNRREQQKYKRFLECGRQWNAAERWDGRVRPEEVLKLVMGASLVARQMPPSSRPSSSGNDEMGLQGSPALLHSTQALRCQPVPVSQRP